nr:putative disease resistance protein rga4 [Quercus suber]
MTIEEALPEECLPNLISLRTLSLDNCPLPQGIRYLTALQHLFVGNSKVVDLFNDWDEMEWQGLTTLLSLHFNKLPKLVSLPMGLQYVSSLQNLQIWQCRSLIAIPEWICKLISLQSLHIWDCPNLESLPEGIGALTSLQTLQILQCPILLKRCKKQIGEDWHKISHIPNLEVEEPDEEEPNEEAKKPAHNHALGISSLYRCETIFQPWNQLILQKYSSQDDSFFFKLFFLRMVEVEGRELKAAGAEPLPNCRHGLCIHGWEIKTCKLSILTSSNLQLWEEKLQTSHLLGMEALCPVEVPAAAKWNFRRLLSCTFI